MSAPPNFAFHDREPAIDDFRAAVLAGLAAKPRRIPPKFFYDVRGSALFDAITQLPEYYPTRTEIGILREHGAAVAGWLGRDVALVELGSGSDVKIRAVLEALRPRAYVPIDISREHLRRSAAAIAADHPAIDVHALCADYTQTLALPEAVAGLPRAAFYPGSSIGNFDPAEAVTLLRRVRALVGTGGHLVIGIDLLKDARVLEAAYNDAQGVTAAFNLNLLARMRDELGADVEPDQFMHRAHFNAAAGCIEMHLVARSDVEIALDGRRFAFARGDTIHSESSYKYTPAGFLAMASDAGFAPGPAFDDARGWFRVQCLTAA